MGSDRQPGGRFAGHPAREAARARAGGEADRSCNPSADRGGNALGRARSARTSAADRTLRAALYLQLPVPFRFPQFFAVGCTGVPRIRALAPFGTSREDEAEGLAVRAHRADHLLLSHLWLGPSGSDVLFRRCRAATRRRAVLD